MRLLILAPMPEVRRWPFYGHALACAQGHWPAAHGSAGTIEDGRFIHAEIRKHLEEARRVVGILETDLRALERFWPELAPQEKPC